MAEFALGSFATMGSNNPTTRRPGQLPTLGSRLEVKLPFAISLLVFVAGIHTILAAAAIYTNHWNKSHLLGNFQRL